MRQNLRRLLCRWFNLVPIEFALDWAERTGRQAQEESARRCATLANNLTIAALGPYGQTQYDAYKKCAETIRASSFNHNQQNEMIQSMMR